MVTRTAAPRLSEDQRLLQGIAYWIPLAVALLILSIFIYGAAQQDLRLTADDPQIQLAEDTAAKLAAGQPAQSVLLSDAVDIGASLAPFMIIYDEAGSIRASSAALRGQVPILPGGVFDSVRNRGEDRFTWQPEPHVRSAAVVTHYGGEQPGFVLVGRSLREVERREAHIRDVVTLGLVASLLATFAAVMAVTVLGGKWRG